MKSIMLLMTQLFMLASAICIMPGYADEHRSREFRFLGAESDTEYKETKIFRDNHVFDIQVNDTKLKDGMSEIKIQEFMPLNLKITVKLNKAQTIGTVGDYWSMLDASGGDILCHTGIRNIDIGFCMREAKNRKLLEPEIMCNPKNLWYACLLSKTGEMIELDDPRVVKHRMPSLYGIHPKEMKRMGLKEIERDEASASFDLSRYYDLPVGEYEICLYYFTQEWKKEIDSSGAPAKYKQQITPWFPFRIVPAPELTNKLAELDKLLKEPPMPADSMSGYLSLFKDHPILLRKWARALVGAALAGENRELDRFIYENIIYDRYRNPSYENVNYYELSRNTELIIDLFSVEDGHGGFDMEKKYASLLLKYTANPDRDIRAMACGSLSGYASMERKQFAYELLKKEKDDMVRARLLFSIPEEDMPEFIRKEKSPVIKYEAINRYYSQRDSDLTASDCKLAEELMGDKTEVARSEDGKRTTISKIASDLINCSLWQWKEYYDVNKAGMKNNGETKEILAYYAKYCQPQKIFAYRVEQLEKEYQKEFAVLEAEAEKAASAKENEPPEKIEARVKAMEKLSEKYDRKRTELAIEFGKQ